MLVLLQCTNYTDQVLQMFIFEHRGERKSKLPCWVLSYDAVALYLENETAAPEQHRSPGGAGNDTGMIIMPAQEWGCDVMWWLDFLDMVDVCFIFFLCVLYWVVPVRVLRFFFSHYCHQNEAGTRNCYQNDIFRKLITALVQNSSEKSNERKEIFF